MGTSTTPKANGRRALAHMTDEELTARLSVVRHTLSIIDENARGCSYYRSIPQVKAERDRNQYEKHAIVKMLAERQREREQRKASDAGTLYHVEYYTRSDSHASADIRAASEDEARAQVIAGGECDSIYSVSVRS